MSTEERPSLRQAIGRGVRHARAEHRQEDLARSARDVGLAWTSSKVAALERGDKAIPVEELILLPLALRLMGVQVSALADLIIEPPETVLTLNDRAGAPADVVRQVLGADVAAIDLQRLDTPAHRQAADHIDVGTDVADLLHGLLTGWPDDVEPASGARAVARQVVRDARQDAEQTAARRFGVPATTVALAAVSLWRHSLTEERDARLADQGEHNVRAARGHVTRELYRELEPTVARWHGKPALQLDRLTRDEESHG